ncbi:endonuclease I family protein [Halobacteriovorax marinus]|uniref:endonuclease I family protein n=1 Tax=Halobacteriovorax marinus TaxID=97084 RepID=UPI000696EA73|nr:endonuclease [Halobacteriovorax marinus]
MKLLFILTTLFATFTSTTFAGHSYYPQSFQDAVERGDLDGERLKDELKKILTSRHQVNHGKADTLGCSSNSKDCYSHINLGYKTARKHLFGNMALGHLQKDDEYYLYGVYCENKFTSSRNTGTIGPMSIPNSNVLNCEHTWPQSKFTRTQSGHQKSDLHHLFPTDSKANSTRGNHDFGEVRNGKDPAPNCDESQVSSSGNRVFQPAVNHRGNVARAMMYFAIRYNGKIKADTERIFRKWHQEDPVDAAEIARNNGVYDVQKNRNPFIDYPELVDFIQDF